jgi:Spy/CpxP family protein refolding chaperone
MAALVIFAAGVVTVGLTVHLKLREVPAPTSPGPSGFGPLRQRGELLDRMQRQLYLTAAQRERIEQILRESHDRMKQLWDSVAPQAQNEHRRVHDLIRAELKAEQQTRFEEIFKSRGSNRTGDDRRRREDWHDPKVPRKQEQPPGSTPSPQGQQR